MIITQIKPTTLNLEKISGSVVTSNKKIALTNKSITQLNKKIEKNNIQRNNLLNEKKQAIKRQLEFD